MDALKFLLHPENRLVLIIAAAIILGSLIFGWRFFRRITGLTNQIRDLARALSETGAPGC